MIRGIILASGFSRRMKKDKLLMEIDGVKMVEKVIQESRISQLDQVILIYRSEEVRKIGDKYGVKTLYNPNANLGQSAGVRIGVEESDNADAYMFLMGDQPFINSKLIDKLIYQYRKSSSTIIVPCYNGRNGTPTIFSSIHRDELLNIQGDKGGRDIIKKNPSAVMKVHIDDEQLGLDIDTPVDFKSIEGK